MTKIDFQPMPKRFRVWDKNNSQFLTMREAYPKCELSEEENDKTSLSLQDIVALFSEYLYYDDNNDYLVCQSTNLFDKDGNEIFEGSIISARGETYLVCWSDEVYGWRAIGDDWDDLYNIYREAEVIGHVLSDPELLKEKGLE